MTEIRPATVEDFIALKEPPKKTARAYAVEKDGHVIGIGGVYRDEGALFLFSELTDELRADKRSLVKLTRAVMPLINGRRVFALADPDIKGSDVLLEHLGFEPFEGRIYQWHG